MVRDFDAGVRTLARVVAVGSGALTLVRKKPDIHVPRPIYRALQSILSPPPPARRRDHRPRQRCVPGAGGLSSSDTCTVLEPKHAKRNASSPKFATDYLSAEVDDAMRFMMQMSQWLAILHAATAADLTWSDVADSDDPVYEAAEEEAIPHPDEAAKEEAKLAAAQQAASQAKPEMAEVAEHKAVDIAAERCSHDLTSCTDTKCCSNPGFGCYKHRATLYAQCKRKVPQCVDSAEWLCPESWADCTDSFGDCRASHCCSRSVDKCMRRSHMYFAQCRPELPEKGFSQCVDWRTGTTTTESWLCPGWEQCAAPLEECTMSRCCTDAVRRRARALL